MRSGQEEIPRKFRILGGERIDICLDFGKDLGEVLEAWLAKGHRRGLEGANTVIEKRRGSPKRHQLVGIKVIQGKLGNSGKSVMRYLGRWIVIFGRKDLS